MLIHIGCAKTMLEVLYSKKFNNELLNKQVIVHGEYACCPNCQKGHKISDSKEYECDDFDVAELHCKHCGKVHYIKLNHWRKSTHPTFIKHINTKKYAHQALEYTRISYPSAEKTNEMIILDKDTGKITVFIRFINIIATKTHLVFEPYYDKYIFNYKNHTAYMVKNKTYSGKRAFGSKGAPLINITNVRYGLWNGHLHLWTMSIELLETLMKSYFDITNIPLYESFLQSAKAEQKYDDPFQRDYKAAMCEIIITMNKCPNLLIDYDAYLNSYKQSHLKRLPFFSKLFSKDFPKTITDKQQLIREMVQKHNVPNSKSFWKLYLDDITNLDKAIYFKQCGFNNPDVIRSLLVNETFLTRTSRDVGSGYFEMHEFVELCDKFRQIIKKMNAASKEHVVAKRLTDVVNYCYMRDVLSMYQKIKNHDCKLLKTINWSNVLPSIHDDLSLITSKIRYANMTINYSKNERSLEMPIDDFVFKLPVDTNELVAIGQEMKICVGSYRESVLSKFSTIVSIQSDDKYVGCIELDKEFNLIQLKGKRNSFLTDDLGDAAKKWINLSKIKNAKRCHDYQNIGHASKDALDYHNLELDNDGNVVQIRRIPRAIVVNANLNDQRNDAFDFDEDLPF